VINPLANWLAYKKNINRFIIPDGMLNYISWPGDKGTKLNKVNVLLFSFLCGYRYRFPKLDPYGSNKVRYDSMYLIGEKAPSPPTKIPLIRMNMESTCVGDDCTVIYGQYLPESSCNDEYMMHVIKMVREELKVSKKVYYKMHPNENIGKDDLCLIKGIGCEIDDSFVAAEFNNNKCSRHVGILSSSVFNLKLINSVYRCIVYPKNLFSNEDKAYKELIRMFALIGCEIKMI